MAKDPSQYEKLGRKTTYTEEMGKRICDRVANGESLIAICKDKDFPPRETVLNWLNLHDNFHSMMRKAREEQGDYVHEEMNEIERGLLEGQIDPQVARVVMQSKQWRAARLAPKRYSEKVINEHTGADGGAIQMQAQVLDVSGMTPEERETMRQILLNAKNRKETGV